MALCIIGYVVPVFSFSYKQRDSVDSICDLLGGISLLYMDLDKKLKAKLSGCMTHNVRYSDLKKDDDSLVRDFVYYNLEGDSPGEYQYLDKQTFKYHVLDGELVEDLKRIFKERLQKRRDKLNISVEQKPHEVQPREKNNVIDLFTGESVD